MDSIHPSNFQYQREIRESKNRPNALKACAQRVVGGDWALRYAHSLRSGLRMTGEGGMGWYICSKPRLLEPGSAPCPNGR